MKKKELSKTSKHKSLKGFTLLEVIIAILVFAIGSSLLVSAGVAILSNIRESRNIVRRVNYETGIVSYGPKVNAQNPLDNYTPYLKEYDDLTQLTISSSEIEVPPAYSTIDVSAYEAIPSAADEAVHYTKASYNLKYFRPVS